MQNVEFKKRIISHKSTSEGHVPEASLWEMTPSVLPNGKSSIFLQDI